MKKLFHGSVSDFDSIDVSNGKGYKDFGKGFYATAISAHADRIALRNKNIAEKRQAILYSKGNSKRQAIVAYRYNLIFDEKISDLKVKVFKKADKEWLRFIINNRRSEDSAHDYDIVIGPTADAETTTIINEYYEELEQSGFSDEVCEKVISELKPENLPKQYFFRTENAVGTLRFDTIKRQVVG